MSVVERVPTLVPMEAFSVTELAESAMADGAELPSIATKPALDPSEVRVAAPAVAPNSTVDE